MNTLALARDYLRKSKARRRALQTLFEEGSYDDVVREAQAIVELILKGTLRFLGVDPPKRHDVGSTVKEFGERLPETWRGEHSAILTRSVDAVDGVQTPDRRCRYTWHNEAPTSDCY